MPLSALPRISSGFSRAWIRNCQPFQVALRTLFFKLLELGYSHVFVQKIFNILNRCHFWPSLGSPRVFFLRGKNLKIESTWIRNCHPFQVAFFLLILKPFEMRHTHIFVLMMFKILNRCHFWRSFESCRLFFLVRKIFEWKVRELEIVFHSK